MHGHDVRAARLAIGPSSSTVAVATRHKELSPPGPRHACKQARGEALLTAAREIAPPIAEAHGDAWLGVPCEARVAPWRIAEALGNAPESRSRGMCCGARGFAACTAGGDRRRV